ncbi:MAG: carbohydrate ABC transporter permease [Alphaproteobacteria bacterium]|nr:carbohydrate ABC transporter permease [Alphaproteobacteria bacterium]
MPNRPLSIRVLRGLGLALIVVWSIFPIVLVALSSFKPPRDIFVYPPRWLFEPTFSNYAGLLVRWPDFLRNLINSAIVTVGATVVAVLASALAGYVYSRQRSRILTLSAFFMIFVRLIPPIVCTLPLFPIVNQLALNDTHLVLILLYATFFVSLGTMVLRAFVDQIPRELDEAAMVDGAGPWGIVRRVILPLAAQGMIAVGVFVFVFAWNEFLFAFIFTTTKAKTAPLTLSEMTGAIDGVEWGVLFAATTVQLLPVLALVILAQKYLIAGLTAGATKG